MAMTIYDLSNQMTISASKVRIDVYDEQMNQVDCKTWDYVDDICYEDGIDKYEDLDIHYIYVDNGTLVFEVEAYLGWSPNEDDE